MSRGSPACFLAILALAPAAHADGLFVWRNEQIDIHEPEQKALIVFDEGVEDLVLSVKFEGAPEEFGWIVPLPSVPEMFPEDILLFEELSKATQQRQFWRSERGLRIHQTLGVSDVSVIATETVGVYEVTVLASESGPSLRDWLKERDFRLPAGSDDVLGRYAAQGWVFAALRIQPNAGDSTQAHQLATGTIQPIRFRFRCKEPVFPLEISSLGRHESTVLLYVLGRDALVPRNGPRQGWETQIHTRSHHWIGVYEYHHGEAPFLPHAQTPFVLTKHRGTFVPQDMHDVSFVGYDPGKALQSKNEAIRTEAATHIGLLKLTAYLPQLVTNLAGPNTYTSLWALGELGGSEAEQVLLGQTEHWDPETRLEAIEALAAMRSRKGLPIFVQGLQRRPTSPPGDHRGAGVQRACFDHLVDYGDASCIPALREIAAADSGLARWERIGANDGDHGPPTNWCDPPPGRLSDGIAPGILAVAALAGCGDVASTSSLVEAILRGGRCTEEASLRSKASARVMHGDYPGGFWTGEVTQHGLSGLMDWCALRWADALFGADSTPRDGIFRKAAADPRLPDAGRVVLLGNLVSPTDDDTGVLMRIWGRAIEAPVMLDVTSYAFRRGVPGESTIRFNANACCVAYALGRHKRVDELMRTLEQAPREDTELHGEIIAALAETGDPRAREVAWSYVRDAFGAASRTPQFEAKLQAELEASRSPHELLRLPPGAFDRAWRERSIWRALFGPSNVEFLRAAITDRTLAPYLRLRVLAGSESFGYFGEGCEALLPIARAELDDLCRTQTSSTFQAYAKSLRESLERTAQTLAIPRAQRFRNATGQ